MYCWFYPPVISEFGLPLILSIGCTIAFSVGRIILAHLTLQEFPYVQVPMFVPIGQLILSKVLIDIYEYSPAKVLNAVSWLDLVLLWAYMESLLLKSLLKLLNIWTFMPYQLNIKERN